MLISRGYALHTVETFVIGGAGAWLAFAYYWCQQQQQKQALQWFYARQSHHLSAQADSVREQLFQKAFALRRSLELGVMSTPEQAIGSLNQCLTLAEAFNLALERASDELSVPFLEDSLPLALQHLIKHRVDETISPEIGTEVTLELPSEWPWQQTDKHRLLLWCVSECLEIWKTYWGQASSSALILTLTHSNNVAKLQITLNSQLSQALIDLPGNDSSEIKELGYIQQTFKVLMPGHCKLTGNHSKLLGEFRWPLNASVESERSR